MRSKIIKAIVTCFYTGCIPIMPGTFGSMLAFPLSYGILLLSMKFKFNIQGIDSPIQGLLIFYILMFLVCILLFVIGTYLVDLYIKETGRQDPKEVVIDEVAGQMLTIILSSFCSIFARHSYLVNEYPKTVIDLFFLVLLPFMLFRLFDILKPWPIDWLDQNVKGGWGVMVDDLVAGIFASIMCYAVTLMIIGDSFNAS